MKRLGTTSRSLSTLKLSKTVICSQIGSSSLQTRDFSWGRCISKTRKRQGRIGLSQPKSKWKGHSKRSKTFDPKSTSKTLLIVPSHRRSCPLKEKVSIPKSPFLPILIMRCTWGHQSKINMKGTPKTSGSQPNIEKTTICTQNRVFRRSRCIKPRSPQSLHQKSLHKETSSLRLQTTILLRKRGTPRWKEGAKLSPSTTATSSHPWDITASSSSRRSSKKSCSTLLSFKSSMEIIRRIRAKGTNSPPLMNLRSWHEKTLALNH